MDSIIDKYKFIKREIYFAYLMLLICAGLVIVMTYFPLTFWENSTSSTFFVEKVSTFIPAIRFLSNKWHLYTNHWGVFYSVFFCLAPVFWFLGYFGTFYISPKRYLVLIVANSKNKLLISIAISSMLMVYIFYMPLNSAGFILDQTSDFFLKRLMSWEAVAVVFYMHARFTAALIIKSKLFSKPKG
jgi:hypothetical protein